MSFELGCMQATVRSILERALDYTWTVQGFGMLRTYLDPEKRYRLNVWHSGLMVPDVSIIHDHPWDFRSWIIAGKFRNQRFTMNGGLLRTTYKYIVLEPGETGGVRSEIKKMRLGHFPPENYLPGGTYEQKADEIHASFPENGAITINDRQNRGPDLARVFWLCGGWVDAAHRPATSAEVRKYSRIALESLKASQK